MRRIKPYVLPAAIVMGLLLHSWAAALTWVVPYLVFTILLLNFTAVDLRKLPLNRLDLWVMAFQVVVSLGSYLAIKSIWHNEDIAQSAMLCVICPVASSVVVVASALGADRRTTTGYTIYGNLLVAIVAPVYFSFIGIHQDMPFIQSAWIIFRRIAPAIALPWFIALVMQWKMPRCKASISKVKEWALVLWAIALLVTIGTTIDYVCLYHQGNETTIVWMAVVAVAACALQFAFGRRLGARFGEKISGAQLTGQKNTGIGIWMASIFLNPLSAVALAFFAIAQNLFNSWQMYRYSRR